MAEQWPRNNGNSRRTGLERLLIRMQSRQSIAAKRLGLDTTEALAEDLWESDLCLGFADNLIPTHGTTIIYRKDLGNLLRDHAPINPDFHKLFHYHPH